MGRLKPVPRGQCREPGGEAGDQAWGHLRCEDEELVKEAELRGCFEAGGLVDRCGLVVGVLHPGPLHSSELAEVTVLWGLV